jgi:hypothetical protein
LDSLGAAHDVLEADQEFVFAKGHPRRTRLMSDVGDGILEFSKADLSRILKHQGSSVGASLASL